MNSSNFLRNRIWLGFFCIVFFALPTQPIMAFMPTLPFWNGKFVYDFSGTITNPNSTLSGYSYLRLTGTGEFGWQTSTCSKHVDLNGYQFTVDSGNGNALTLSGVISGSGTFRIISASSGGIPNTPLYLSGNSPNTYSGAATLTRGVLGLNKPSGVMAITGNITVDNQGSNDKIKWFASNQIEDTANITFNSTAGNLDLNNYSETVNAVTMVNGATLLTGTGAGGVLTVSSFTYNGSGLAAGTYTSVEKSYITGNGSLVVLP